jgi:hypothetical protein
VIGEFLILTLAGDRLSATIFICSFVIRDMHEMMKRVKKRDKLISFLISLEKKVRKRISNFIKSSTEKNEIERNKIKSLSDGSEWRG